jgi:transketolase
VKLTKENLGWPLEPKFYIPEEALAHFRKAIERGQKAEADWQMRLADYRKSDSGLAAEFDRFVEGELPAGWTAKLPTFSSTEKPMATRQASGKVLNAISSSLPTLLGGSADLAPSTDTLIKGEKDFSKGNYGARNFHFGVREHAMGAIINGMALTGLIPYGATFFVFSDYLRPTLRLAALMGAHSIFVFTHDSIFLGEDGPTHQPIEHLAALRAIPNLSLIRPADANETAVAWRVAIEHREGPVALCLSRQGLPIIDRSKYGAAEGLAKGAYVLADAPGKTPEIILIATGSELAPALEAYGKLTGEGVAARLVSMPSWDLFEKQPESYRDEVLPPNVTARLAIEAATPFGWERHVGTRGDVIGIKRFGASAPYKALAEHFGFSAANIVQRAHKLLGAGG